MRHSISFQLILIISAFSILHSQSQTVLFNPNMLAHSQGLPNELLLFAPDTAVQILFNPARGATSGERFVYTNYLPQSNSPITVLPTSSLSGSSSGAPYSSNPTISAAAMYGAGGSPWLLQLSNWTYRYTSDYASNAITDRTMGIVTSSPTTNTYVASGSLTAIKLSTVGTSQRGSFSAGVFGIIYPGDNTSNIVSSRELYSRSAGTSPSENRQISSTNGQSEASTARYLFGLEYSLARPTWDFIASLTAQKNITKSTASSVTNENYMYTSPTDTNLNNYATNLSSSRDREPLIFGVHGYFQHSTDFITPSDHYFVSSDLYYSDGTLSFDQTNYRSSWNYQTGNQIYGDTLQTTSSKKEQMNNWGGMLSFGYVMTQRLIDIDIILGINPQIGYDDFKEISPFYSSYYMLSYELSNPSSIVRHEVWSAEVRIPIYLNFTPVDWFSLFGGLTYRYAYAYDKSKNSYPVEEDIAPMVATTDRTGSQTVSQLNSTSSVFAGAVLRHASGLRVQIAFRGNVSQFSGWNISMGYVY